MFVTEAEVASRSQWSGGARGIVNLGLPDCPCRVPKVPFIDVCAPALHPRPKSSASSSVSQRTMVPVKLSQLNGAQVKLGLKGFTMFSLIP